MGTHFARLKAPLIWYDILHVLDVLTQFPWAWEDARLQEMVALVAEKADAAAMRPVFFRKLRRVVLLFVFSLMTNLLL